MGRGRRLCIVLPGCLHLLSSSIMAILLVKTGVVLDTVIEISRDILPVYVDHCETLSRNVAVCSPMRLPNSRAHRPSAVVHT
jgi:hypothetical protein